MNLRRALVLALAGLLLVQLLPVATADHAYSHRYVIWGRVVDAEGNPVPGQEVKLDYQDFENEGSCGNQPGSDTEAFGPTRTRPVTNEFGEFVFCTHAHRMSRAVPGTSILTVEGTDVRAEVPVDPYLRTVFVPLTLDAEHPDANATAFEEWYTVQGRLWRPTDEARVEGVPVWGDTLEGVPVNVTLEIPGQEPIHANTTSNNYGDFALRIPIDSRPSGGTVTVEAEGEMFKESVEPALGTTFLRAEFPEVEDTIGRNLLISASSVLAGAVLLIALAWGVRRYRTAAEERAIRAASTRKRANR